MSLSKRDAVAIWAERLGFTGLLRLLPSRPVLLVLTYHRLGDPEQTPYYSETFSTTSDRFDEQISFLKQHFRIATLEEATAIVEMKEKPSLASILITFDDGYLDCYTTALPILLKHDIQATFFISTSFIGTPNLPLWDVIASIVKKSQKLVVELPSPYSRRFNIPKMGVRKTTQEVLQMYKLGAIDSGRFLAMVEDAFDFCRWNDSARCFMNWEELKSLLDAGMRIGSHGHAHEVLSKLSKDEQVQEVTKSKALLQTHLGVSIDTIAYPFGFLGSFSSTTRDVLREAQYRVAFSCYSGVNTFSRIDRYDVRRQFPNSDCHTRFKLQVLMARSLAIYWP